jgi:four helix bundle protein
MNGYKDLIVWQKGMNVAESVYALTKKFPKDELFGIVSQMRRAAVSIPSNIAEGWRRKGEKEKSHFYSYSLGSISELETQIEISVRIGYISKQESEALFKVTDEVSAMLFKIIDKVNS